MLHLVNQTVISVLVSFLHLDVDDIFQHAPPPGRQTGVDDVHHLDDLRGELELPVQDGGRLVSELGVVDDQLGLLLDTEPVVGV